MNLDVTISISVELIGAKDEYTETKVYLSHLNKTVVVRIPNSISESKTMRLKELGNVAPNGDKGDLFIKFEKVTHDEAAEKQSFCFKCGARIISDAKFCSSCGTPIGTDSSGTQRQQEWVGQIVKCPMCGEVLKSFESNCPACGYELRGAKNSRAVQDFATKLLQAETRQQKITIIRSFPVPNTKEDIMEFMILASSNVDDTTTNDISAAWLSKIEQVYQKARLLITNETEFAHYQDIYTNTRNIIKRQRNKQRMDSIGDVVSELMPVLPNVILTMGWLLSLFILIPLCGIGLDNVGANSYQILLTLDFIAGAIFLPMAVKCDSILPKMISTLGLLLSMIVMIPLCGKNLDAVGSNMYQFILFVDIVCSIIIFCRIFKRRGTVGSKKRINKATFIISLISLVLLIIVYAVCSVKASMTESDNQAKKTAEEDARYSVTFDWPQNGLSEYLPVPETNFGVIKTDDEERFNIEFYKCTAEQFENYVDLCMEQDFTINTTKTDSVFYAYHEDELKLNLFFNAEDKTLDLFLDAPLAMSEIQWPDDGLAKQLPVPESLIGNIRWNNSDAFGVYISNTTQEDFNLYIEACKDKGFTDEYSQSDTHYRATKNALFGKDYEVSIDLQIFDKMYIHIEPIEKGE